MSKWIDLSPEEMQAIATQVADKKNITEGAVEKDWWVTAILKAVFSLPISNYITFKGGTSLSKGWDLINRFSEDIDLALDRDFYLIEREEECAKVPNNNQIKNLRKTHRAFINNEFCIQLNNQLEESGLSECKVSTIIEKEDGSLIDSDSDPVVIEVHYPVKTHLDEYVRPVVKIEISCLSMKEPFEIKTLKSLVGNFYPEVDEETTATVPTILPTRTFLEKAFLLNEEYQRKKPKTERMSRHLYDLERLMDTSFAKEALEDMELYRGIIDHRKKFYHLGSVDYELNIPQNISFCPEGEIKEKLRKDYENMKTSMIYGDKLNFDELICRLEILQERFRETL